MKRWIIFLVTGALCLTTHAQNKQHTIKGRVVETSGVPIPYCNVALYQLADSSLVKGTATADDGRFSISAPAGSYSLRISFVSYKDEYLNVNITKDVDVGRITMKEDVTQLDEVTIVGEKSLMNLHLDKKVYNVSRDVTNVGANAAEILDNIPSVSVDIDGNVSLRGSEGVQILIDGKPSAMTGIRSTDALRNLQGSMIESVEIITNPSSRHDAAGESGIINIILKKNKQQGFNGNFSATAGYPERFGASYSINYRTEKINLFSSYGASYRVGSGSGHSDQHFSSADTSYSYTQTTDESGTDLSHNFMAGMDYYFDTNTSLTGTFLYEGERENNLSDVYYDDYDMDRILVQRTVRTDNEQERGSDFEASLSFRKKMAGERHELTADVKWTHGGETEKSDYTEGRVDGTGDMTIQRSENPAYQTNWLFQADYVRPLGANGNMEAGLKATLRSIMNDYVVEQQNATMQWDTLTDFNNEMHFDENIYAAYLMAGNKFGRLSAQAGLRGEFSDVTTELIKTDNRNRRSYFDLFPSVSLGYELDEKNTLQLSYSYRINRPRFRNLTPFANFSDTRSYFVGNPDLNPEYTHSVEAGYLFSTDRFTLLPSIYYRHKTGVIQRISTVDTISGITHIIPVNLATQDNVGLDFNMTLQVGKWWRLNSNFNFYRTETNGAYDGESLHSTSFTWSNRTASRITLWNALLWQTTFNYRAPYKTTQGRSLSMYSVDMGLSTDIFKGRGTLTLNVRDLLDSRKRRSVVDIENYRSESEFQWRPRSFTLTFTYRINQRKVERERENDSFEGNEDFE